MFDQLTSVDGVDYPSYDPKFALGFEAGAVWRLISMEVVVIGTPDNPILIHVENLEFFRQLAAKHAYQFYSKESGVPGLISLSLVKRGPSQFVRPTTIRGGRDGL